MALELALGRNKETNISKIGGGKEQRKTKQMARKRRWTKKRHSRAVKRDRRGKGRLNKSTER